MTYGDLNLTSGYLWRSDTIRPCLQARVAAFGSQDLGFRTSIFGSQHLGFRTSINGRRVSLSGPGFQDLESSAPGFTLRIWVSGPQKLSMGFTLRTWVSRPRKLSILRPSYLFPASSGHRRTQQVPVLESRFPNPTVRAGSAGGLKRGHDTVRAGSAGELKRGTVVSDRRTHGRSEFIYKIPHPMLVDNFVYLWTITILDVH
jgi:hypothetical protein